MLLKIERMKELERRNFFKSLGISALGLTAGMSMLPKLANEKTLSGEGQKIKITGIRIMVVDNIPPYAGHGQFTTAGIAEAHYAMIAPHMYCGPVAFADAVQLDTSYPNFLIQEYNHTDLHSDIPVDPIRYENGFITLPTGPGLGIELNEKVLKKQMSLRI